MKSIIDPSALFIDLGAQKRPTVISIVGAGENQLAFLAGRTVPGEWQACINHYDDTYVYANISLARGFLS